MTNRVHFSIDDILGCLKWLSKNEKKVSSIFDSYVLNFSKQLHEIFGVKVSLFSMYTDGEFTLKNVSDKWKKQFQENSEWLKIGFHAYNTKSCYKDISGTDFEREYKLVLQELIRITGGKSALSDKLRLHYFSGNQEVVKILSDNGIKCLLCADDSRQSYN